MTKSEIHIRNKALKARLWKDGLYVQEVGQEGKPDYLIVSCADPEPTKSAKESDKGYLSN